MACANRRPLPNQSNGYTCTSPEASPIAEAPFGFALFYLRGVAPPSVPTSAIYRGVVPFILMQLGMLLLLTFFPQLATWLPDQF